MKSAYELSEVQALIEADAFITTLRARNEAKCEFGFTLKEIAEVCLELTDADFDCTILSKQSGRLNDVYIKNVYSPIYGRTMSTYIKLEVLETVILISFHTQTHF